MLLAALLTVLCVYFVQVHVYAEHCVHAGPPEQIRIALRGPDAVTISWKTYGKRSYFGDGFETVNDTPKPEVEYSIESTFSHSSFSEFGTSTHYNKIFHVSWFHNCAVSVKPSTKYYYRIVASLPCVSKSEVHSFTTQLAVGNSNPINITIVGDLGVNKHRNHNSATKTIAALAEAANNTHFFLHVGDISYADDPEILPFQSYEGAWNTFQQNMEVVTADNIYMTLPGNHEVTCNQLSDKVFCHNPIESHYRNFTAYLNRFRMPGDESNGYKNLWYSFDYGLAHFAIINTETDFPNAPAGPGTTLNGGNFAADGVQLNWLKSDLEAANANRKTVPWIIVAGHRPFYGSKPHHPHFIPHSDNCESCRVAFEELIFNNSVDFYICGHVHFYERLYPVNRNGEPLAKNYTNQPGLIHVTNGAGGAAEGANTVNKTGIAKASAKIISSYGYTRLEIKDSSNCRLTFYDSVKRAEVDSVDILRIHE